MINELIDQMGGRDRLEQIKKSASSDANETVRMARALLAVLDAQPVGTVSIVQDLYSIPRRNIATVNMRSDLVLSEMRDGDNLYAVPPAASAPDALKNFKDAMYGIGHIKRTIEETFGGIHGTHCEPDVLIECKQICDAIYSAYRATSGGVN